MSIRKGQKLETYSAPETRFTNFEGYFRFEDILRMCMSREEDRRKHKIQQKRKNT